MTVRLNVAQLDNAVAQPFHEGHCGEPGAVVRPDHRRFTLEAHQPAQRQVQVLTAQRLAHLDRQAFSSVMVEDAQNLEWPPLAGWSCTRSYVHTPWCVVELGTRMSSSPRRF